VKTYIHRDGIIASKLGEELVMLDIQKGKYFSLNPVATFLWELLDQPLSLPEICKLLMEEYEVDYAHCASDVDELLKEMIKLDLIKIVGSD
jgi:hypothetical protein